MGLGRPEKRPRRVKASVEDRLASVLWLAEDEVDAVSVRVRAGVQRTMRALPSRIRAMHSSSRLSGRGGRGGGGPGGLMKGMVVGTEVVRL